MVSGRREAIIRHSIIPSFSSLCERLNPSFFISISI